jgi:hypothetical protein
MVTNGAGTDRCPPLLIERAMRDVRDKIDGVPEAFSFHDLRHSKLDDVPPDGSSVYVPNG